jgi:hypothetical protein
VLLSGSTSRRAMALSLGIAAGRTYSSNQRVRQSRNLSALNHFTTPLIGGPEGPPTGVAEPGSGTEYARLSVLGIAVEFATPRIAEILMSHSGSWRGGPDDSGRAGFLLCHGSAEVLV